MIISIKFFRSRCKMGKLGVVKEIYELVLPIIDIE